MRYKPYFIHYIPRLTPYIYPCVLIEPVLLCERAHRGIPPPHADGDPVDPSSGATISRQVSITC